MSSSQPTDCTPVLQVKNLRVQFSSEQGPVDAVRGISFQVGRERVAIVGESGSGKSTVGRSILKLHSGTTRLSADVMRYGDIDLLDADEERMRQIRGRRISMIMQDPKYSLNPVMTVGEQLSESFLLHGTSSKSEARDRSIAMLEAVQIRDPLRVLKLYPFQISGGMGQRVMIAMMLAPNPDLLIADEPTSALDVTVRMQVLSVLDELVEKRGLGLIFISHDLGLVSSFCDRVLVMYAGQIVESISSRELGNARHPYTQGLLDAMPRLDRPRSRLPSLQRDPAWLEPVGSPL